MGAQNPARLSVAVVGASDNPERMAYQAVQRLMDAGHRVFPVHPKLKTLLGLPVFSSLREISESLDTVTLYVSASISSSLESEILSARPRRVIFNPGAENPLLAEHLMAQGVETLEACTLVLLSTKRF